MSQVIALQYASRIVPPGDEVVRRRAMLDLLESIYVWDRLGSRIPPGQPG